MAIDNEDIKTQAIMLVESEKTQNKEGIVHITNRVAFNMRNLIKQCRKNYWGVFDKPVDPQTGRKKIWYPLTEIYTENVVKNIDLDSKDVNFRAKQEKAVELTALLRNLTKNNLDSIYFGEIIDDLQRRMSIDGTAVAKIIEVDGKLSIEAVDLLNVYIDATAKSIQDADRFTERSLMTPVEISKMDWLDNEDVQGRKNLHQSDQDISNANTKGAIMQDVYELWGLIPKSLITGNEEDKEEIEGHVIVSGLETGDKRVHLIEENKEGIKPYEEAWYTRVPGRWYGRGVAEKLLMMQVYMNTIVNIRVNRSFVSQLGIFKVKRNRGITPQMLSRLTANGAVLVDDQDDITQMVMQEASQASYTDETNINNIADRLTSAFEVATGESLPATTSATATAIQSKSAQSQFVLIKEGFGMFMQRLLERHAVPIIIKNTSKQDIIRTTGESEDLRTQDEKIAVGKVAKKVQELKAQGAIINQDSIMKEAQRVKDKLQRSGEDRFVTLMEKIDPLKYDVKIYITNEEMDKGILAQNLLGAMQIAPEFRETITRQLFDLMGLDANSLKATNTPQIAPQAPQGGQKSQNPQVQLTNANTIQ